MSAARGIRGRDRTRGVVAPPPPSTAPATAAAVPAEAPPAGDSTRKRGARTKTGDAPTPAAAASHDARGGGVGDEPPALVRWQSQGGTEKNVEIAQQYMPNASGAAGGARAGRGKRPAKGGGRSQGPPKSVGEWSVENVCTWAQEVFAIDDTIPQDLALRHVAALRTHHIRGSHLLRITSDQLRDDIGMVSLGQRMILLAARDAMVGANDDASGLHSATLDAAQHSAAAALAAIDSVNLLETLTQSVLSLHEKLNTIASTIPGSKPHPSTFPRAAPAPQPSSAPAPRAKAASRPRKQKAPARPRFTTLPSVVSWSGVLKAPPARQAAGRQRQDGGGAGGKALTDTKAASSKDAKGANVTMSKLSEVRVPTNVTMSKLSEVAFDAAAPAPAPKEQAAAAAAGTGAQAKGGVG
eukprot:CAMPEP_0173419526 /NCGR_PEP_ID=MMETSP1357-20121228/1327_1 /TAXON_ID=77926 /ORGANISM="Hemiselmis rufescens, Strain PCC563" /LENGTH=410 /DNA_ID=CAMNT_0014382175 /DNA_START=124 /DNA_END=1353 /DNA_ORIENTATION=-